MVREIRSWLNVDSYNQTVAQKRPTERGKLGKALITTGTFSPNSKRRADHREKCKRAMESRPSSPNLPVIIDPFWVRFGCAEVVSPLPCTNLNLNRA